MTSSLSSPAQPTLPQSPMQEAFTWIWKTFGEPAVKGGLTWGWKAAQWKLAADRYAERLQQDYGKLFVLGQPEPKDIDDIYTYVNVLEKVSAFKRYAPEKLHELFVERGLWHDKKERRDGVKMVETGKNLFILGQPGAGKTTFLKQVTIRAARGQMVRTIDNQLRKMLPEAVQEKLQETKEVAQIPIFVSLKAHADAGRSLFESIEHELQVCRFPEAKPFVEFLLKSGRALVLCDGLDEVSQDEGRRDKLSGEMREFMRQYRETQFVITCRVAATEYTFDNVDYLEMADFDDSQMNTFIHNWFSDRKQADQCRQELQKEENKGLRELARNPLLLTLLAIAYEETLTFPQRRVEIYEEAIDALLKKWDSKRRIQRGEEPYKALSLGRKRQMLARIGAETFGNGEFILPQSRLANLIVTFMSKLPGAEADIDGEAVLNSIAARHGIFVERSLKLYSFAHLSFQEYFAAKFIVDNTRQNSLEQLLEHIAEDQWRELFLLTASLLNETDADDFFGMFVDRLNGIIAIEEPIQQYLIWAQKKAEQTHAPTKLAYKPVSIRAGFLTRLLDHNRNFSQVRYLARIVALDRSLALAFNLALDRTSDQLQSYSLIRERALDPDLSLEHSYAIDLDRALSRAVARVQARHRARKLHLDLKPLERIHALAGDLDLAILLCNELEIFDLGKRIEQLKPPKEESSQKDWEMFLQALEELIDEIRDLSGIAYLQYLDDWDKQFLSDIVWDWQDLERYTQYLKGTVLLSDCLKLAAVSNRAGIEERLLLPAST